MLYSKRGIAARVILGLIGIALWGMVWLLQRLVGR